MAFNFALRYVGVARGALPRASPVWALLWEAHSERIRIGLARWGAALLALSGVGVLLAPSLAGSTVNLTGELWVWPRACFGPTTVARAANCPRR